jgi:HTH-like domain
MVGPAAKREAVAHLRGMFEMSERRACTIIVADRKMIRYQSRRAPDADLRARLRDLANERRRFGYRRLFILLRREGEPSGINRIYRLYREEGFAVRKRRARRKAVGTRSPIVVAPKKISLFLLKACHQKSRSKDGSKASTMPPNRPHQQCRSSRQERQAAVQSRSLARYDEEAYSPSAVPESGGFGLRKRPDLTVISTLWPGLTFFIFGS